jgi:hypothetical protein
MFIVHLHLTGHTLTCLRVRSQASSYKHRYAGNGPQNGAVLIGISVKPGSKHVRLHEMQTATFRGL